MTMRKPTELRVVEGNPGHRAVPNSPKYPPLLDDCPRGLPREGKRAWQRVTAALEHSTTLQASDYHALVALCEQWAVYRAAIRDVLKRGPVVTGARSGDLVRNPSWIIANQALATFTGLAARFGRTPVDRAKIVADHFEPEKSPLQEIIEQNTRR